MTVAFKTTFRNTRWISRNNRTSRQRSNTRLGPVLFGVFTIFPAIEIFERNRVVIILYLLYGVVCPVVGTPFVEKRFRNILIFRRHTQRGLLRFACRPEAARNCVLVPKRIYTAATDFHVLEQTRWSFVVAASSYFITYNVRRRKIAWNAWGRVLRLCCSSTIL